MTKYRIDAEVDLAVPPTAEGTGKLLAEAIGAKFTPPFTVTVNQILRAEPAPPTYPAGHGWTPATGPFASEDDGCRVMLARYPCNYTREQHDPDLPPVELDVFGYRRTEETR